MRKQLFLFILFLMCTVHIVAQSEENDMYLTPQIEPGFYAHSQKLVLESNADKIYYTTDGSIPGRHSKKYNKKYIRLKKTTALRLMTIKDGITKEYNYTYFIKEDSTQFMTVSLTVDPSYLFSKRYGVFKDGPNIRRETQKKKGANYWSRRESKAHVEFFEPTGHRVVSQDLGIRLFGGFSRQFPQKSLVLEARKKYGSKRIKYPIFGEERGKKFKTVVLRNSGSDYRKAHFRDAMMTDILKEWDVDIQAYRPAHVYINGKYWGIYNFREKLNKNYIKLHHDLAKDDIDLMEGRGELKAGSKSSYLELLDFLKKNDISIDSNYAKVKTMMDVENYMQHQIAEIYYDNTDASGNVKYWRAHKPGGKWRWMLYDTDFGMGLWNKEAYKVNTLEQKTDAQSNTWPNPKWSTLILRKLLDNEAFKEQFLGVFMDAMNKELSTENILAHLEYFEKLYRPEIKRHHKRWHLKSKKWEKHLQIMATFAKERPSYMRQYLTEMFDMGQLRHLTINKTENGSSLLNTRLKIEGDFDGQYFEKQLLKIQAIPLDGFVFSHWEGIDGAAKNKATLNFKLKKNLMLTPVFEKLTDPLEDKVVINELSTNNHNSEDWIELYNTTEKTLDLKGWVVMDSKHKFVLPYGKIPPYGYLVLCQNQEAYTYRFPEADNYVGDFKFGLNRTAEKVQLFSNTGALIDVVDYKFNSLEKSYTMSLLLPELDNDIIDNWEIRKGAGTPNAGNPYFLESKISAAKSFWVNIGIGVGVCVALFVVLFAYRKERPKVRKRMQVPINHRGVLLESRG